MDREIPKEVRDKERKKMLIKYGVIGCRHRMHRFADFFHAE